MALSNTSCRKSGSPVESRPGDLPTLTYLERPKFRRTILIVAWLDGLTRQKPPAGRYARSTGGCRHKKFASIDPEYFYDFSQQRPTVSYRDDGVRMLNWPTNEFFYWQPENVPIERQRDLIVFLGVEPHLQWRTLRRPVARGRRPCKRRSVNHSRRPARLSTPYKIAPRDRFGRSGRPWARLRRITVPAPHI